MKFKTNYFSLLLLVFLVAGGISIAGTPVPANAAVGVSNTTNFTFAGTTTLADEYLQVSDENTFTSGIVIQKDLGAIGAAGYTFSSGDLIGHLSGKTSFANNTPYYWRIMDNTLSTVEEPLTAPNYYTFTTFGPPTATLATGITVAGTSSFYANWNPAPNGAATSYILTVGTTLTSGAVSSPITGSPFTLGNVLNYQITGLTNGSGPYYYSVQAVNSNVPAGTNASNVIEVTLTAPTPPLPANGVTGVSVLPTFTWAAVSGALSYILYVSSSPDFTAGLSTTCVISGISGAATSYDSYGLSAANLIAEETGGNTVFPLTDGTEYYWKVDPVTGSGEQISTPNHFTTAPNCQPILSAPVNSGVVYTTPANFAWYFNSATAGLQFILQYKYAAAPPASESFWSTGTGFTQLPASTPPVLTANSITGNVDFGLTYYWRVLVQRTSAPNDYVYYPPVSGGYNTFTTTPIIAYPSWPFGGNVVYTNPPTLAWYLNEYISSGLTYNVNISPSSATTGGVLNTSVTPIVGITGLTTPVPLLVPGTYYWQVQAVFTDGSSVFPQTWSTPVSFVVNGVVAGTTVVPIPSYPDNGETVYTTSPTLYWYLPTASSGLKYDIDIETSLSGLGNAYVTTSTPDQLYYQVPAPLTAGQTYYWAVRSRSGSTTSDWSLAASFNITNTITSASYAVATWPNGLPPAIVYTQTPALNWYLEGPSIGTGTFTVEYKINAPPADWTTYSVGGNDANGGIYTPLSSSTFSQTTATLNFGATYYWAVFVTGSPAPINPLGEGSFMVTGAYADPPPVLAYPGDSVTVYGSSVPLTWYLDGSAPRLSGYIVQYTQSDQYTPLLGSVPVSSSSETCTISGLIDGATYYWNVIANYTDGTTTYSPWYSFTVNTGSETISSLVEPHIGGPTHNLQLSTSSPMLSWMLSAPIAAKSTYQLELAANSNFSNAQTLTSSKPFLQATGLNPGNYFWRVRSVDSVGNTSAYSGIGQFSVKSVTAVTNKISAVPKEFAISQNYPNPFNPSTIIDYALPKSSLVTIKIYNILGQEVKTLLNTQSPAGYYSVQWNGENNFGQHVSSGIYIYRVVAGQYIKTMKMVMLK